MASGGKHEVEKGKHEVEKPFMFSQLDKANIKISQF